MFISCQQIKNASHQYFKRYKGRHLLNGDWDILLDISQNKIVVHMYIYLMYDIIAISDISDKFIYLFIEKTKTYIYRHCFCVF